MFTWIGEYSDTLSVLLTGLSALVWLGYLQILSTQLRRSSRPVILISRSAGRGRDARLFVSNMGAAPIYVTSLIAEIEANGTQSMAFITDADDISNNTENAAGKATNEGPLGSGQYLDVGTYDTILKRIERHAAPQVNMREADQLVLTVVASTGYSGQLVGARRGFRLSLEEDAIVLSPHALETRQISGPIERRRLQRQLRRNMRNGRF